MKSKKNQRLLALILSMVLMLSASISAMAEGDVQTEASGTEVTQNQAEEQSLEEETVPETEVTTEEAGIDTQSAEISEEPVQETTEQETAVTSGEATEPVQEATGESTETEVPTTEETTGEETQSVEGQPEEITTAEEQPEETSEETLPEEEVVSEAAELKQEFTDENGNVTQTITAYVPEGAFQATADQISMEVTLLNTDDTDHIKGMMEEIIPEDKQLDGYVLYEVKFLVNGVIAEPAKAITLTIEGSGLQVTDLTEIKTFRYDPADPATEGDTDELVEIGQKTEVLSSLTENGIADDKLTDQEYSELEVKNKTVDKISLNIWKSTIYGCYTQTEKITASVQNADIETLAIGDYEKVYTLENTYKEAEWPWESSGWQGSDPVRYQTLDEYIPGDDVIEITNWKRSDESKREYKNLDKLTNSENTHWSWRDVSGIQMSLSGDDEVWDGSRSTDHYSNSYLKEDQVTAYDGTLYDSATWNHYNDYGQVSDNNGEATIHRFQGTFTLLAGTDPNNYNYTIKPVADSDNIFINDDIYVFVYPESMKGKINDDNFMQYLAFWTGTISNSQNNDRVTNFHGRTNTKATQDVSGKDQYFGKLTDSWNTPAAEDNAGGIILSAYNANNSDTTFIVDVFAEDYNASGGMYRLEVKTTPTTRVNGQFRKVDAANTDTGVSGAEFELIENDSQRYYTVTSGEDGIVNLRVVPGTYTMREVKAAPGYKLSNETWTVKVSQNGDVTIYGEKIQRYNGKNLYYITNESDISGNLVFKKVNSGGNAISGAVFELYQGDTLITKGTSGSDGTVRISNIPVGNGYVLKEVSVPSPYILPKETWTVNVASNGETTLITSEGEGSGQIVNYTEQEEAVKNLEKDKTVETVGNDGRTFKITLSAKTSGKTADEASKNASIVLVLDASDSMEQSGKSLQDIKDAAKSFVAELGETSPKSEVAVIWYKGSEGSSNESIKYTPFQAIENGKNTIDDAIDSGSASGGTPMGAALEKANEVLRNRANENKYVLMFTDGMPGFSEGDEPFNCMVANKAYSEAKKINEYAKIYTIGYKLSGSFDWKPGHSGDSEDPDDHEGEYHRWGLGGYYTYNHPINTSAANFLKDYIATEGSGDQQYAFTTENKDGLKDIFTQLAGEVGTPYSIQADSIVDVIDARFELTGESKNALKEAYGNDISIVPNDDGTTTITWSDEAAYIRNETEGGWTAEFEIRAKENFIGGNMIPTNGAGSGIHVDEEHFTEFPKPTANVKLLDLDLEDKEKTFFLGDQITVADLYEKLLKTLTMEENQIIPNLVSEDTGWENGEDKDGKQVISLDYSYPGTSEDIIGTFEFVFEPVDINSDGISDGNLNDHEADKAGKEVEQYRLTVKYTSKSVTERQTTINADQAYKDPVGQELTSNSLNRPIQVTTSGIYTIHVIAGKIEIVKKLDDVASEATTFNFKVTNGTDEKTVSIIIPAGESEGELSEEDVQKLTNLKRGAWTVTETLADGYAIQNVKVEESTNCQNQENDNHTVTFTLGNSKNGEDVIQDGTYVEADGGVLGKVEFTNEKVIPNWQIVKVSTTGKQITLGGAEFTLVPENEPGTTYYGKSGNENGIIQWHEKADFSDDPVEKIKSGNYVLTETKAPSGYAKSEAEWSVLISENGLKSITSQDGQIEQNINTETGLVTFYFENEAVYDLPSAGGPGIFLYMIGGTLLLMAGSLMIYINRRRGVLKK